MMDDQSFEKIETICAKGEDLAEQECYEQAIEEYKKALELVPEPKYDDEASVWIYAAIGDAYFMLDEYEKALMRLFRQENATAVLKALLYF